MATNNKFYEDPVDLEREIDVCKLKPTGRNWSKTLREQENYIPIEPKIFEQFDSVEQINKVLEQYLEKKSAQAS